jgi:hypothetical protein
MFQALDVIAVLTAQHLADLFDDDCACECPRCCLACRSVNEVMNAIDLRSRLAKFGIEGHLWQDSRGSLDRVMIGTKWHNPCPVYQELDCVP